jgi:hypothetical protein
MHNKIFEQLRKVKIICKTAMVCQKIKNACGVIYTACTMHAVSLTPHARFLRSNRSYLGEFEAEFNKALARESGAQGVLFDEKKPRVENLVTLSL